MQTEKKLNRNKVNLAVDFAIFAAFLVAMAPRFSGIAIHEWLGISFGAAIVAHLLLHWQWIINTTRRIFRATPWESRINYVLNLALFIDVTIVILTGLMVSEAALPLFGLRLPRDGFWMTLHTLSADVSVFLIGLHVAMHWSWIVKITKRFIITPLLPRRRTQSPEPLAQQAVQEVK
jgi:hypothetical protein